MCVGSMMWLPTRYWPLRWLPATDSYSPGHFGPVPCRSSPTLWQTDSYILSPLWCHFLWTMSGFSVPCGWLDPTKSYGICSFLADSGWFCPAHCAPICSPENASANPIMMWQMRCTREKKKEKKGKQHKLQRFNEQCLVEMKCNEIGRNRSIRVQHEQHKMFAHSWRRTHNTHHTHVCIVNNNWA